MGVPFGLVKTLQTRSGLDFKTCKAALVESDGDIEAAAAALGCSIDESAPSHARGCSTDQTYSGVTVLRLEAGDSQTYPRPGDTLSIHYRGTLVSDGTEFDSSYARNKPFNFKLGNGEVIPGWEVGIPKLSLGERAVLTIGSELGYGAQGHSGKIPPHADLRFEVHLMSISSRATFGEQLGLPKDSRTAGEFKHVAAQLLGQAPQSGVEHRLPDDRQPMPLTADMPR